jgi:flagellar hook-basal body complex protein FliE
MCVGNDLGMKNDPIDKAADTIKGTIDDVRDTAHEASHRAKANAERERRDMDDTMTPGEKAKSMAEEAKNRIQANVDEAKRRVRHS